MPFFEWKDEYSIGIKKIDEEHKNLVQNLNELYEALKAGTGRETLEKVLSNLVAYTKTHFATEENLMMLYKYPEYEQHKAIHEKMTGNVLKLVGQYRDNTLKSPVEITNFLKDWLTKHIMRTDKKYGPFLKGKGVS